LAHGYNLIRGKKRMKSVMDKSSIWFQMLGLFVMILVLAVSFSGKDDALLQKLPFIGILIAAVLLVVFCAFSSGVKGTGIFFILLAVLLAGMGIFLISKGYASGKASDCGVYKFRAVKYWQEQHTTRVRYRTTRTYTNYVKYQGVLDNGETVEYNRTTSSIGDAMNLVKKKDTRERQVFLYNGNYYTDEPGTSEKEFVSRFLKWRRNLFLAAILYGILGVMFILFGKWLEHEEEANYGHKDSTFISYRR